MLWPEAARRCCRTPRQRQVHVVAAQQDVVANGDAFQRQFAVLFGNHNEAEIRGAAADVAHQNEVADLDSAAPAITLAFKPRVKSCLRLFQQCDLLITGLFGGAPWSTRVLLRRTKRAP